MSRSFAAIALFISLPVAALAASGKQPAPPGAVAGAPPQYTQFTAPELMRGFMALAFGSDLRIGAAQRGIRRFNRPIRARVIAGGSVDRSPAMTGILKDYAGQVPALKLSVDAGDASDIDVRLIDEKDFKSALERAFGVKVARAFVARTNPQCMTSVKSDAAGDIIHAVSFVIVDRGEGVFRDCAYHELLHAFGLSNHDQSNPWTALNQTRGVGYLSVYDRDLLTLLYDPRLTPGISARKVRAALPRVIEALELAKEPSERPSGK